MNEPIFRGALRPLALPDLLRHLRSEEKPGALVLTRGNRQSLLYLHGPLLVDAVSSHAELRLAHRLMAEGKLTAASYDALQSRLEAGSREGAALVEMGVLDPAELHRRVAEQVMQAATEPFAWERGEYLLLSGQSPEPGRFRQRVRTVDLAAEGLRRVADRDLFRDSLPSEELVVEANAPDEPPEDERAALQPFEEYVRDLLDGKRTVGEVAGLSEIGAFETYRTLFLLLSTGHARLVMNEAVLADAGSSAGLRRVLKTYNAMFVCLHEHLLREVGPIAVQILEKSLRDVRGINPGLLEGVELNPDGRLDRFTLERNLRRTPASRRERLLVEGLNEFLYAALLGVKRTLGRAHEAEAVRLLRGVRHAGQAFGA